MIVSDTEAAKRHAKVKLYFLLVPVELSKKSHPKCQIFAMNVLKTSLPNITKMEVLKIMINFKKQIKRR